MLKEVDNSQLYILQSATARLDYVSYGIIINVRKDMKSGNSKIFFPLNNYFVERIKYLI